MPFLHIDLLFPYKEIYDNINISEKVGGGGGKGGDRERDESRCDRATVLVGAPLISYTLSLEEVL